MDREREYLGDGVYAEFDGFHVILRADTDDANEMVIYLESACINALWRYVERVYNVTILVTEKKAVSDKSVSQKLTTGGF